MGKGWEQTKMYISLLVPGTASLGDLWKYLVGFGIITLMQGGILEFEGRGKEIGRVVQIHIHYPTSTCFGR